MNIKKTLSASAALLIAASTCIQSGSLLTKLDAHAALNLGTYEAEELDIGGQEVWTSIYGTEIKGGYSGSGFVYLNNTSFSLDVEVETEGMYSISARCAQILSEDGRMQTISVNGIDYTYTLPYMDAWEDVNLGVFRFKKGVNKIEFKPQYGYAEYDTITVGEADLPELYGDPVPCDPEATNETKALMQYLSSVYGKNILSGQQEIYGSGHPVRTSIRYDASTDKATDSDGNVYTFKESDKAIGDDGQPFVWTVYGDDGKKYEYNQQNRNYVYQNYDQEFDYIYELSGAYPAIRGFDFMNYNPLYGWDDGTTERAIKWVNERGGIATACWHINIPTDFDNYVVGEAVDWSACTYKNNKQFSIANAVTAGTKENDYFNLAIEDLAEQFQLLADANVPLIFRPFHEAEGNGGLNGEGAWFWWSQDGAEDYKALWRYLYDQLTNKYGLHNIIWEQNLYAWSSESAQWYVGDDYVDIVGYDKYNTQYNRHDGKTSGPNEDAESKLFYALVDYVKNNKLVSMPENDSVPSLTNMLIEKAYWLYFCVWYDNGQENFLSDASRYNDPETLKELYTSDLCIMLDELPDDLYTLSGENPTAPTKPTEPTTDVPPTLWGDATNDGKVLIDDVVLVMSYAANPTGTAISDEGLRSADVYQNGDGVQASDAASIQKYLTKVIAALPES